MKEKVVFVTVLAAMVCVVATAQELSQRSGPVYVSEPVVPTVSQAVRDLPDDTYDMNRYGLEMKRREDFGFIPLYYEVVPRIDPLLELQANAPAPAPEAFSTLIHNFAGQTSTSSPPDTTGDVGLNHFVQGVNQSVSTVQILNKSTGANMKTFSLQSLASGSPCNSGYCDPIVLYDRAADRWMISEFPSSGGHLCVYVSTTGDPAGTWYAYTFSNVETSTPDYPKYGVWPQNGNGGSYLVGINAGASGKRDVVALDRAKMLAGQPATYQKFSVTAMPNSGFQLVLPATVQGSNTPPNGAPALFMRPRDRAQQDGVTNKTYDLLEMWALNVDWATPANSTLTVLPSVQMSPYDMTLCGMGNTWNCMPQPGTTQKIDPIREPLHFPLQYRNFGDHETLVGCYVTDVDGTDHAALRWFEVRKTGTGNWTLFQEGLVGGEANIHRSVGSAAMDGSGNIAIGYTRTGTSAPYYPSIYFKGRLSTDPVGTMPQGEYVIQDATSSKTGNERWGDYAGIGIDPSDDCTYWFTTEYGGSGQTKVAAFKFDGCGGATYSISGTVSGAVTSGVTMTLSGAGTGTTTTGTGGTYTFSGRANGSYTVTPSLSGYTFSPVSSAATVSGANVTGVNFTSSAAPTYSISGTVSGAIAAGVTISLTGAATATTTTATGGTYTFAGLANGSYTVTPSLSGYTFSPTSTAVTISSANQTGKDFVATAVPVTYSISGTVSGAIAAGVTMSLTGAATATTTTATGGTYTFAGLANGSYTVTPSLSGYTFSPTSTAVTISGANQTGKNFTSTAVSGDTPLTSGVGVAGSVTLQAWKYYTIVVPSGATNLSITLTGLSADIDLYVNNSTTHPTTSTYYGRSYNGSTTNESLAYTTPTVATWSIGAYGYAAGNFTVTATVTTGTPTYSISGTVSGAVASGVTMTLSGAGTGTTTTDATGSYTFSGRANGSYTVTPSLAGYTFSPTSIAVTISGANQTGKNFTSTSTGGQVTLFTNGFEGTTGWAQVDTSGTAGTWSQVTSGTYPTCSKHGGTYMAKFNSYNASSGAATRYYRTSGFAIASSYTTVTWTFWMYHDTGYTTNADKVQPQVSTNGTTWTNVGSAINRYDGSTGWKQHTVTLTTYKGSTVQLGFLGTSAYGNNIYLDDALVVAQ
ncbi:MAG TPA: hypothetical protein PLS53_04750 [Thermoanaerobaculaceae bacterium]|nr:hypothetical protein [Thermoanaerobaculaceae bacterium]